MRLTKNTKIFINYFLGPLLFIWLSWSIYNQIKQQPDLGNAWHRIKASLNSPLAWNVILVMVLMIINWSIEAIKWQISVKPLQKISFITALQAVFSGVSFSVSTPNRVGEFLGRGLYMNEGNRLKSISITIVGSISQLIITLFAGWMGMLILREKISSAHLLSQMWMNVIIYGVFAFLLITLLFYFRLSFIVRWADRMPASKKFSWLIDTIEKFDTGLLLRLLLFSFFRFIIFSIQYYLLFSLFGVEISWWQAFWTVNVSFLVMAIIPTIAIAELAQRGKVVTALVGLYSANGLGITFATAGIWFINLIIPAVIGSLLIVRRRIRT
jgi:uncharacterized membrane protein YbhN (UPF0104 family)